MPFNSSKCVVLHLGGCNRKFSYHMGSTQLELVSEERDLGVMICSNLNSADSASTHMPRLVKHLDSL